MNTLSIKRPLFYKAALLSMMALAIYLYVGKKLSQQMVRWQRDISNLSSEQYAATYWLEGEATCAISTYPTTAIQLFHEKRLTTYIPTTNTYLIGSSPASSAFVLAHSNQWPATKVQLYTLFHSRSGWQLKMEHPVTLPYACNPDHLVWYNNYLLEQSAQDLLLSVPLPSAGPKVYAVTARLDSAPLASLGQIGKLVVFGTEIDDPVSLPSATGYQYRVNEFSMVLGVITSNWPDVSKRFCLIRARHIRHPLLERFLPEQGWYICDLKSQQAVKIDDIVNYKIGSPFSISPNGLYCLSLENTTVTCYELSSLWKTRAEPLQALQFAGGLP